MSQIEKIGRAEMFVQRNKDILRTVEKLLREYDHNHQCAKRLFIKSNIDKSKIPEKYRDGSYPSYCFSSE